MQVFELVSGYIRHFVAAKDADDAYRQGTDPERFPDLHFRPFDIIPVTVEGYTITATSNASEGSHNESDDVSPRRGRKKASE